MVICGLRRLGKLMSYLGDVIPETCIRYPIVQNLSQLILGELEPMRMRIVIGVECDECC